MITPTNFKEKIIFFLDVIEILSSIEGISKIEFEPGTGIDQAIQRAQTITQANYGGTKATVTLIYNGQEIEIPPYKEAQQIKKELSHAKRKQI